MQRHFRASYSQEENDSKTTIASCKMPRLHSYFSYRYCVPSQKSKAEKNEILSGYYDACNDFLTCFYSVSSNLYIWSVWMFLYRWSGENPLKWIAGKVKKKKLYHFAQQVTQCRNTLAWFIFVWQWPDQNWLNRMFR